MRKNNKPHIWMDTIGFPPRGILDHRRKDIKKHVKTSFLTFTHGKSLPFDSGNPNLAYTMQDPKDYDLTFYTDLPPDKWLKYDCLPNNLGGEPPIINKRTLKLLKNLCPEDFQEFPVIIKNGNPKLPEYTNHEYYLLNITHNASAIDIETSIIRYFESGNVDDIRKLVLQKDCLQGYHLTRIDIYSGIVLVSTELVNIFKKEKITGVRFLKDYEAYPYIPPEECLYQHFQNNKESAKRYFVSILNKDENYELFKKGITNIPPEIIEELIEMTLSRSSFHAEQCAELRELLNNTK